MEMIYSAWSMLKDIYSYDEITNMPMRDLLELVTFFTPKIKELQEQRANSALTSALTGQSGGGPLSG